MKLKCGSLVIGHGDLICINITKIQTKELLTICILKDVYDQEYLILQIFIDSDVYPSRKEHIEEYYCIFFNFRNLLLKQNFHWCNLACKADKEVILMPLLGTENHLVNIEGIEDYVMPKPER